MSKQRAAERSKVMMIGGAIAVGTPAVAIYAQDHPALLWAWFAVIVAAMVYVVMQLVKIKKSRRQVR